MSNPDVHPGRLRERFFDALAPEARDAIEHMLAVGNGSRVYAVAGILRDLLLDRPFVDVDLAVEHDAIDLVREAFPNERVTTHARFRTASITIGGTRIDVATTRRESYARPGALPSVGPASIDSDLLRRDFSVNAIALSLNGDPALLDPTGGVSDVEAKLIRVLHDRSFINDPTRIFRAHRYAARLGFAIEPHTAALEADALSYTNAVGGERLRRELELILSEREGGQAMETLQQAGALRAIHPSLSWEAAKTNALARGLAPRIPLGFALLASAATASEAEAIVDRLRLKRDEAAVVRGVASVRSAAATLERPGAKPSGVVVLLDRFPAASVAAFAATHAGSIAGQLALRYLEEWRSVKTQLNGRDLQQLGVPEGPQIQKGLQLVRAARLDGWITDRRDEEALALRFAKSIRDSSTADVSVEVHLNGH